MGAFDLQLKERLAAASAVIRTAEAGAGPGEAAGILSEPAGGLWSGEKH
jgi:hypothetical protein